MLKVIPIIILTFKIISPAVSRDPNGYLLYCPCIGEFGQQTGDLLNALAFSKGINRTLVVPPWLIYKFDANSVHVPYDRWFSLVELKKYHKVILFKYFMEKMADSIWPQDNRTGYCRVFTDGNCEMVYGNPFGTFWRMHNIVFTEFKLHDNKKWDTAFNPAAASHWLSRYPPSVPVLALRRPPGRETTSAKSVEELQRYVEFSPEINKATADLLKKRKVDVNNTLAVQLFSGQVMKEICKYNDSFQFGDFFSSAQCTGVGLPLYNQTKFTDEMCNPSENVIVRMISKYLNETKATTLFVSTDDESDRNVTNIIRAIRTSFGNKITVWTRINYILRNHTNLVIDLAIMSKAKFFIGNCVNSYSSFVRRRRQISGMPFAFFGHQNITEI